MHIVYFFTYGYSLKSWSISGILDRELKIFEYLIEKYDVKFTFITYGNDSDLIFDLNKNINVVPIYSIKKERKGKVFGFFNSFLLTSKLLTEIGNFDLIKQNQLLGSWVSIMLKIRSGKPLYIRTGYDMFVFSLKDRKSIVKKFLYFWLTQITLFFSDIYSVTSESDFAVLEKYFLGTKKVVIRANWVEQKKIFDSNNRSNQKILTVGRLEEQKDYPFLIRSLEGTGFVLDIIGEGTKQRELENLAAKLSVKVNFLGIINNTELLALYGEYKYFISTSSFEGNPKAILEAMGSGCLVLANNIPNNSEIISHLENGILFSKENGNLKRLILSLNSLENVNEISQNAVEYVAKFNSIEKASLEFYNDFDSITSIS